MDFVAQHSGIKRAFPGFDWRWRSGRATWRGEFQPTEHSGRYKLRVVYTLASIPKVFVTSHKLDPACGHLYPDGSLCLYWPKEWCWSLQASIADTILPWAANWLYFYELWLDTGRWLGPSSHDERPGPTERDKVDGA